LEHEPHLAAAGQPVTSRRAGLTVSRSTVGVAGSRPMSFLVLASIACGTKQGERSASA